jgi:hypothetical protein
MKIYVVPPCGYDEYGINGVYLSAEEAFKAIGKDWCRGMNSPHGQYIEEWDTDTQEEQDILIPGSPDAKRAQKGRANG